MLWCFGLWPGKLHFSPREMICWWQLCPALVNPNDDINPGKWLNSSVKSFSPVIWHDESWASRLFLHAITACTISFTDSSDEVHCHAEYLISFGGYTSPLICPKSASWHPYFLTHPDLIVCMPGMTVFLLGIYSCLFCCCGIYLCSCVFVFVVTITFTFTLQVGSPTPVPWVCLVYSYDFIDTWCIQYAEFGSTVALGSLISHTDVTYIPEAFLHYLPLQTFMSYHPNFSASCNWNHTLLHSGWCLLVKS